MKTLRLMTIIALIGIALSGCKKDETTTTVPVVVPKNTSFTLNGTKVEADAKWKIVSGTIERTRVFFETGTAGKDHKKLEIDIYGSVTGSYAVEPSPQETGKSTFSYTVTEGGIDVTYDGVSGTVAVTVLDGTKVSGTFTVNTQKTGAATVYVAEEGKFTGILKD